MSVRIRDQNLTGRLRDDYAELMFAVVLEDGGAPQQFSIARDRRKRVHEDRMHPLYALEPERAPEDAAHGLQRFVRGPSAQKHRGLKLVKDRKSEKRSNPGPLQRSALVLSKLANDNHPPRTFAAIASHRTNYRR